VRKRLHDPPILAILSLPIASFYPANNRGITRTNATPRANLISELEALGS